ncbi:hypothetical protein AcW1_008490 [Taiwanofungus camphoratus]|nr:hypothetical protein AcW1_008490 [Antrodia cinnamomea]KAI0956349.1 hypothetical protein AcV7_006776 [Antrodia cinnamomea]
MTVIQTVYSIPPAALESLSVHCSACIERLKSHQAEETDISGHPSSKLAAVLVLLYEKAGELRVLLTTRSKFLRAHPGQTALPGGKVDESDEDVVETALREAHEEVSLPLKCPSVHILCIMRPFLSSSKLLVTPVVALLTDLSVLDRLKPNEGEVDQIFDHPLEAVLDPSLANREPLVQKGSVNWPYDTDLHVRLIVKYDMAISMGAEFPAEYIGYTPAVAR